MDKKNNIKCLLLTSYMPPLRGGSAVVYENLLKYGNDQVFILTAEKDCQTNQPILDAREYRKKYQNLFTLPLLRQQFIHCNSLLHSLFVFARYELPVQLRVFFKVIALIKSKNIDVICIGELYSLGWLANTVRFFFKNIKVIFYIHGEELTVDFNSSRYTKSGYKYLQQADGIVAVSSFTKNTLINQYNVNSNKIELVSNGVDINHFNSNNFINRVGDIDLENTNYILFVGRLIERKGIDYAIQSMAKVIVKYPEYKLLIAGEGSYHAVLIALAQENKLTNSVVFLGLVSDDELNALYCQCKLFLMPNRSLADGDTEGFGLVFLEANAFGKPVIAGKAGGAPDAVVNGQTGLLVNSESIEEIGEAVIQILDVLNKDANHFSKSCLDWAARNHVKYKVQDFIIFLSRVCNNDWE